MLRIGRIKYANCTPIFHALEELYPTTEYDYVSGVPARLNALLATGEIDVCPSSSIEFALHAKQYLIAPGISISSFGPVKSVLLFSSVPVEQLDRKTVLLSSESATSVNLLKILLKKRYGCDCSFRIAGSNPMEALQEAPALLLIGDAALKSAQSISNKHIYDLGTLWRDWTGLPFVFALWFVSRKALIDNGDSVRLLARQLLQAKPYAAANLERIADVSPEAVWMGRDNLVAYWKNNISYELGAMQLEGLKLFYQLAAELELIESAPELAFLATE